MSGKWADSSRRSRLPKDWPKRRSYVRRRAKRTSAFGFEQCEHMNQAGGRCRLIGNQCDHIVAGDDHRHENLQWLCVDHHQEKTAAEATAARADRNSKRLRANRRPEQHPGVLPP